MAEAIDDTLKERGSRYGSFEGHARLAQELKDSLRGREGWKNLTEDQREAMDMICHKMARIINGDPNFHDSWHDIVGYAKLVADRIAGVK